VIIQADGKLVTAGSFNGDFAIGRFNSNGSLDTTFGGGDGVATIDFNDTDDEAFGMNLDAKGRAVVVGRSDGAFALARLKLGTQAPFDYDGDGKTDFSVYRPSNGTWYVARSLNRDMYVNTFWSHALIPADYDGDGKTDLATPDLYDNGSVLVIFYSSTNTVSARSFFDAPLPSLGFAPDFDGDGKADPTLWTAGLWQIALSSGTEYAQQWGMAGDKPVPADFDGDGRAELAVFRPSEGKWYIANFWTGAITIVNWGVTGDIPVVGDYNGDGRADYAVYRPSNNNWYRMHSSDHSINVQTWGAAGDVVTPGDYDGDGRMDIAVFRPSEGEWYVLTAAHTIITATFGQSGDVPTPSAFIR
jgi:hypothetical protein